MTFLTVTTMQKHVYSLLAILLFLGFSACQPTNRSATPVSERKIAAKLRAYRWIKPRLSMAPQYQPCIPQAESGRISSDLYCPRPDASDDRRNLRRSVVSLIAESGGGSPSSDSSHLSAVALLASTSSESSEDETLIENAITMLLHQAGQSDLPTLKSDLSAAFFVSGQRHGDAMDLMRSLDWGAMAAASDPDSAESLFNLGLAQEALGFRTASQQTWDAYLQLDADSRWAEEVEQKIELIPPTARSALASNRSEGPRNAPNR